jgi:drug/metabolite transporter (DMT)-like permease
MHFSGPLLIAIAALLWGLDGILRRSLYSLEPITIVFYEHLIGALILLPFLLRLWRKEKLTTREWWAIILVSLLSGVLGTLFFTTALAKVNFIPFSVVYLIQKLQPIFTMIFAAVILKERLTRHFVWWAALAIAAAYFVTFPGGHVDLSGGSGPVIAALFALLAAIAWASSTAFSRYTLLNHSHTFITGLRFSLTTLLAIPFVMALGATAQLPEVAGSQWWRLIAIAFSSGMKLPEVAGSQWWRLIAIAFSSGMIALWIYYRGLKSTKASVSTIVELIFPLTAVIIDIFLYNSVLAPSQYLAAAVLLVAVYQVARQNKQLPGMG